MKLLGVGAISFGKEFEKVIKKKKRKVGDK